ncbi:Lactose permease [compost metagenome]
MSKTINSKSIYWQLSAYFFFFQLTWAAGYSLFAIWLGEVIGLDSVHIALILSVNAIFALSFKILYGYVMDKVGLRKHVLWIITVMTVLVGPFFIYIYGPLLQTNRILGMIIGGFYLGLTYLAGIAAIESYAEKCGRKYHFEYGKTRMWGSLGWAVAIFYAGRLYNVNPDINFWIASGSAIVLVLILLTLKVDITKSEVQSANSLKVKDVISLFKMKEFWKFILFVAGVVWSYFIMEQQFSRYYVSLFADPESGKKIFGYLSSLQVFLEAGMLFLAPLIVNKIGPKRGLLLAGLIMVTRIIGSGLVSDPISISLLKLMHAVELPVLLVSVFKYIAANFDHRLSSSVYLIGYQSINYVGIALVGPLIGEMYEVIGFADSYLIMGGVALLFTIISCFTLSEKREQAENNKDNSNVIKPKVSTQ